MSGNTVWRQASGKWPIFDILVDFCLLKMKNLARFARNVEWDFV